jgi:hypothetical protein
MLYTSLTRQQDRIVLLHEDEIGALQRYTHPSMSEIARRMTDLFTDPEPIEVVSERGPVFLEKDLIHRTSRNELVRSKAELAIAEKLHACPMSMNSRSNLEIGHAILISRSRMMTPALLITGSIWDFSLIPTMRDDGRLSAKRISTRACVRSRKQGMLTACL